MRSKTLFELLSIKPDVPDGDIDRVVDEAHQKLVVKLTPQGLAVPADFETACEVLKNPTERQTYRKLYSAWERKNPLLCPDDQRSDLSSFCSRVFFKPWNCPDGMVDEEGTPDGLDKKYVFITLATGEVPPWYPQPKPPREPWKRWQLITFWSAFIGVVFIVSFWLTFYYVYQAPERLADEIRTRDATNADLLDAITSDETKFSSEVSAVIGPLPADGSMSDELARICFREKTAGQAWDAIRSRGTDNASLAPFQTARKTIEERIAIGTFLESDRKRLEKAEPTLRDKAASFPQLRRDLDLLRVLIEAEHFPPSTTTNQKGNP